MHGPIDQGPGQHSETVGGHLERVAEHGSVCGRLDPFVAVTAIEPLGAGEPERDGLPGDILLCEIPDWAVSAARADAQRTVELHPGPRVLWPERIVSRRQRIDKSSDAIRARLQLPFVNVEYLHGGPPDDAQRLGDEPPGHWHPR
jgi:hypothetical protein